MSRYAPSRRDHPMTTNKVLEGLSELVEAARRAEVSFNTVRGCYERNPGNFAVAMRELERDVLPLRAALANITTPPASASRLEPRATEVERAEDAYRQWYIDNGYQPHPIESLGPMRAALQSVGIGAGVGDGYVLHGYGDNALDYNGCHQQAIKALTYIAKHGSPAQGGEQFPNIQCCLQIADELGWSYLAMQRLLAASQPRGEGSANR